MFASTRASLSSVIFSPRRISLFGGVVLGLAVVCLYVELHAGNGDEHEQHTEDESPVLDGGPFEAFGVGPR